MTQDGAYNRQRSDAATTECNHIQEQATASLKHTKNGREQSWAKLLRGWLPSTYEVVTKGRIILRRPALSSLIYRGSSHGKMHNCGIYHNIIKGRK